MEGKERRGRRQGRGRERKGGKGCSLPNKSDKLKLLRSTDSFRRDLKTFLFYSVYRHQDTD